MLAGLLIVLLGACDTSIDASSLQGGWHHDDPETEDRWNLTLDSSSYTLTRIASSPEEASDTDVPDPFAPAVPGGLIHAGSWALESEFEHPDFANPQPYSIMFSVNQAADPSQHSGSIVVPVRRVTDERFDLYDADVEGRWRLFRKN